MKAIVAITFVLLTAASCPGLELKWSTVDSGGVTIGNGGGYRMGGTIGQVDAGMSTGKGIVLVGGFWAILRQGVVIPTPTSTASPGPTSNATPTKSSTPSATPTRTAGTSTPTPTPPVSDTPTPIDSASPTPTQTGSPHATATATSTPTPTPTPTPEPELVCVGDCSGNERVTVDELLTIIGIALGAKPLDRCLACDADRDRRVTIEEVVLAVDRALNGCPPAEEENGPGPGPIPR
jgi:hypothetical protein